MVKTVSVDLWFYVPLLCLGRFFTFLIFYTVGWTPWTGDQPVSRPLAEHRAAQRLNAHRHPYLKWDSKPMTALFERVKTVYALDRPATVIGKIKTLLFRKHSQPS
jgi:hypothetical protein